MRFADFPFLRYLPFLIAGVLLSQKGLSIPVGISAYLISVLWVLFGYLISRKKNFSVLLPAFLGYGMLFFFGILLSEIHKNNVPEMVYEGQKDSHFYLGRVEKHDITKPNSFENLLEVIASRDSSGWRKSSSKVIIYHKSKVPLKPGMMILVEKSPEKIPPPIFPNEFDYQSYLARKDIRFRQFIGENFLVVDSVIVASPKYWLANFRKTLAGIIEAKVPDPESRQIASALLLGQQESLDKEIKNAYAETGTMHILAVSGLHVGIIYAILLFPLKGIQLKNRPRKVYLLVVILLIWLYAILTGFSPSVVRAATMFSLFTAGQMRARKPSPFNILAFSAMIMIVFDPGVIFEVGFQLSYVAVAGIFLLQPLILRWWLPLNPILEYFWQMTAVSITAQLATFPLSIFYFHIFPTYFLIANLFIIPISFLVMQFGIPLLVFSWVPMLGEGLGWIVSGLIWVQNWTARTIQLFPGGNMDRLTITFVGMMLVWGLCIIWANWELGDRKRLVYGILFLLVSWSVDRLIREAIRPAQELLIFKSEKGVMMDLRIGERAFSWNENFPPEQISFSIDPNRIARQRPQIPESVRAVTEGTELWFPVWDFRFEPGTGIFRWGNEKPIKIQKLSSKGSKDLATSDSLNANVGAFRIVF